MHLHLLPLESFIAHPNLLNGLIFRLTVMRLNISISPSLYSLSYCSVANEGFRLLALALKSNPSHIRELRLSRNEAGDSEVKHLSFLLMHPNCKLKKLQ